ncbi:hypothetical protein GA707_20180 [Nostocoides sp. F2B08]|uniref:hypothetical protein n=1 Tax=Nostocoides sp. F2B08 TaxID=2653936 RepID=UPI0012634EB6|nr:hypothetical protein [Tetrasphaera sp. F2B08]KAB7739567.1 hypothetical protein GA707_20180 [Tetrasphaera sp. F2B08]
MNDGLLVVRLSHRLLAVVLAGSMLSSCSGGSDAPDGDGGRTSVGDSGPALPAYIDEETGTVALPADQFRLSEAELDDVVSAGNVALIQCVENAGINTAEIPRRVIPDNDVSRMYGLWRMSDAQQFGYVINESPEKLAALERNAEEVQISEAEMSERRRCAGTPEVSRFHKVSADGVWDGEFSSASEKVQAGAEWAAVISDWVGCLARAGIQVDSEDLAPAGVDWEAVQRGEVTENDVRLAVADVTCKNEVSFIKRLTAMEAAAQSPIIARHRDELLAERARLDAMLVEARAVLAAAGL